MTPERAAEVVRVVEAVVGRKAGRTICLDDALAECTPLVLATCGPERERVCLLFPNLRGLDVRSDVTEEDVLLLRRALGRDDGAPIHADEGA